MKEEKYSLRLTKPQMGIISRALEIFERAQMGQFKIALEQIFEYERDNEYRKNLKTPNWDEYNALENIIKTTIFASDNTAQRPNSYFGITGSSESAKIAYEIEKTIGQFLAVEREDGYWGDGWGRQYDDPLKLSKEPLPEVVEFKKYKDYPIPQKHYKKLRELHCGKKFSKMWDVVDEYIPKDIKAGGSIEIYPFSNKLAPKDINGNHFEDIVIRIWKPSKKEIIEDTDEIDYGLCEDCEMPQHNCLCSHDD